MKRARRVVVAVATIAAPLIPVGPVNAGPISANGEIAFTSNLNGGDAELFTVDPTNGAVTPVVDAGTRIDDPAWSPDGTVIAYSQISGLSVVDPAAHSVVEVTDHLAIDADDSQPAWSPDGTMIAFTRIRHDFEGIWRVNADGTGLVQLTAGPDRDPAWSPDGGSIAFTRTAPYGDDLFVMNPDGSAPTRMTLEGFNSDPAWSPDGGEIAFVKRRGPVDIHATPVDDPESERQVTNDPGFELRPTWSPDGTRIAYESHRDGDWEIFAVNADGTGDTQLTFNAADDHSPTWQPLALQPATAPTCSIGGTRVDEGNTGSAPAMFEIDCDNPTTNTLSVSYASSQGTAHAPADFTMSTGTIAVPVGRSHTQISVSATGDVAPEPHETFTVTISSDDVVIDRPTATATIVDDDGFGVSVESVSVLEGDLGFTDVFLDMRLSHAAQQPVKVEWVPRSPTEGPSDVEAVVEVVTFEPGEVDKPILLRVYGDTDLEGSGTVEIVAASLLIDDANAGTGELTILDDEVATLSIGDARVTEGDSGEATASFTVSRSFADAPVSFDFATENNTATAGDDYVSTQNTISFDAASLTATIEIPVLGDLLDEPDETFHVRLSNPTAAKIADDIGVATVEDNDAEPTISIDDINVAEGAAGASTARFTLSLSAPSAKGVTVDYATEDGSATSGDDYSQRQGTIAFGPLAPTATIEILIVGDLLDEPNETFRVRLSNPTDATIADDTAIATIDDDDAEPTLSIDDVNVAEGQAGTATARFTVSLSAPTSRDVTVTYATADGTAQAPADYSAIAATPFTIPRGSTSATIDVIVNGDPDLEDDETFIVELTSPQNASIVDDVGVASIVADESPANDDFADAMPLLVGPTPVDTSFASIEPAEPGLAHPPEPFPSVWYRFSPGAGGVELDLESLHPFTPKQLSVYTGTSLNDLTLVQRTDNSGGFPADNTTPTGAVELNFQTTAGQTYYVQVLSPTAIQFVVNPTLGQGTLTMAFHPVPVNDDFANPTTLLVGPTPVDTSFASIEPGEPGLATPPEMFPSVWYRLTPGAGGIELDLESLHPFTAKQLSVYTGTSLTDLTLVAHADNATPTGSVELNFQTTAGRTYYVQVLSPTAIQFVVTPTLGHGTLTMTFHPVPVNDDFANAAELTGTPAAVDTSFASVETGEPGLATPPEPFPSVWYRLAPGTGGIELELESVHPFTAKQLSVYTGTSLDDLTLVARADNSAYGFPGDNTTPTGAVELNFQTTAGQTYYVQVLAPTAIQFVVTPALGLGTLTMAFHPVPVNDDFANAAELTGTPAAVDTSFASVEPGEPGLATPPEPFPSVWYRLAPGLGTMTVHAEGLPNTAARPRQLAAYTGTNLGGLTTLTRSSTPSPFPGGPGDPVNSTLDLQFGTECGTTYYVQALGPSAFPHAGQSTYEPAAGQGTLTTQFQPTPLPTNDAFADAVTLGLGTTTLPRSWWTCASAEPGEPTHGGAPAAHSSGTAQRFLPGG